MASQTATVDGFVTTKTTDHYTRIAQSGAGLMFVEYTFVHASGRSEEHQLGASTDEHILGLSHLAKIIQQSGALPGLQLSHGGGKSSFDLTKGMLMAPSPIAVPVKGETLETPNAMTKDDIELWKTSFIDATRRAVQAGFDLVEFHSAHGYGLNQWLSPITNQRVDEYGQNLQNRSRLLREIIQTVRKNHPKLLISVRLPGQDFLAAGLTIIDTIKIAKDLEALGVNFIHVSSGIGGWKRPLSRNGEGYLVKEAAEIQAQIGIPVIGVGGIQTAEYIDRVISEKTISLAAVGRAILQNPTEFKKRVLDYGQAHVPRQVEGRARNTLFISGCS